MRNATWLSPESPSPSCPPFRILQGGDGCIVELLSAAPHWPSALGMEIKPQKHIPLNTEGAHGVRVPSAHA